MTRDETQHRTADSLLGEAVKEINDTLKAERAFPLLMDVTKRESVKKGFKETLMIHPDGILCSSF